MGREIVLDEVNITAGEDEEERRRREAAAALDPLASLGDDVSGAVGDVMTDTVAQGRALDEMRAPAAPPAAAPAPASTAALPPPSGPMPVNAAGVRGVRGPPPTQAPAAAVPAPSSPRVRPPPSQEDGAAESSSGPISSTPLRAGDPELEAAIRARNGNRTKGSVIDAIALLLGGGGRGVTEQVGVNPGADQPLEDLRLRRSEEARRGTAAATAAEAARATRMADPTSPESRSQQQAMVRLGFVTPEQVADMSATDLTSLRSMYLAQQRQANQAANREDTQANQAANREDAQGFSAEQQQADRDLRLQIAGLRRRPGGSGGGGGGAGGAAQSATQRSALVSASVAAGEDRATAEALIAALPPREVSRRASELVGALTRAGVSGDHAGERAALTRVSQYHRRLDDSGVIAAQTTVDEIEGAMSGASDGDVQQAIAAMNSGESALAALSSANPRAARIAQAVTTLQNVQLRQQSGAAVSAQEFTRFRTQLGSGSILSAAPLRNGISAFRRSLENDRGNIDAGFPDVVESERAQREGGGQRRPARAPVLGAQPQAPAAGTVRVRRRRPGGEWQTGPAPREQIERMRAAGWEVEESGGS